MHGQLEPRVEETQDHVETHPCECQPARPVIAAKQIHARYEGYEIDEFNPRGVVFKGMPRIELGEVSSDLRP